ncbi:MAG: hypothetical protein HY890_06570 [Deltaproteobacteria bacterium]|nr:hypothetical protein [Deltaproteobacteria bacterium]
MKEISLKMKMMAGVMAVFFMAFTAGALFAEEKAAPVKTIFDYKTDLGLTDDQVKKIKENLVSLERDVKVLRAKITIVEDEVRGLVGKDGDMAQIKSKIREGYDIQASIRIADIEATRKINAVLKPEQFKKWKEIQAAARVKK